MRDWKFHAILRCVILALVSWSDFGSTGKGIDLFCGVAWSLLTVMDLTWRDSK